MSDPLEHEIRELRSLYWNEERDPDGRAFAPLADAYRRAGDLDQAVELLEDGLNRHPTFTSGHLVAAWVHQARGDEIEAESAYRTVLGLDEENATALYGLGRILAARGEESGVEMVMRSQELDPILRRPGGAGPAPLARPVAVSSAPADEAADDVMDMAALAPADDGDDDDVMDLQALAPDRGGVLDLDALAPDAPDESEIIDLGSLAPEGDDEVTDLASLAPESDEAEVLELASLAPESEDEVVDLAALSPDEDEDPVFDAVMLAPDDDEDEDDGEDDGSDAVFDLAMLAPESATEPDAEMEESEESAVVDLAELAPAGDGDDVVVGLDALAPDGVADSDEDQAVDLAALAPEDEDDAEIVDLQALAPEAEAEAGVGAEPEAAPASSTSSTVPPGAPDGWAMTEEELLAEGQPEHLEDQAAGIGVGVMTRTMAELFVKQGLSDRAIDIYEKLVEQAPGDASLAERLDELRAGAQPSPAAKAAPSHEETEARHDEIADSLANTEPDSHGMTPFAWTEDESGDGDPAPQGPPVVNYFSQLLGWPSTQDGTDDAPADPTGDRASDDSDDDGESPDEDDFFNAWVDRS